MPCTCRMVTPYSSPPSTKVRNCSAPEAGSVETTAFMATALSLWSVHGARAGPGTADDSRQIEDERHRSIAEDRGTRHSVDVPVIGFEGLDDDLLLAEQVIDEQPDAPP